MLVDAAMMSAVRLETSVAALKERLLLLRTDLSHSHPLNLTRAFRGELVSGPAILFEAQRFVECLCWLCGCVIRPRVVALEHVISNQIPPSRGPCCQSCGCGSPPALLTSC